MSENTPDEVEFDQSITEYINEAITRWLAQRGGGFVNSFFAIADIVNSDGNIGIIVAVPDDQPTHRSMGLATYADMWFRDDAQVTFSVAWHDHEDDE